MAQKKDCIDFEKLKKFPVVNITGKEEDFRYRFEANPMVPDFPLQWALPAGAAGEWALADQDGVFHRITPLDAWDLRKPLPLDHEETKAFIESMKLENANLYLHPTAGLFSLDFLEQDLIQYDVTQNPEPIKPFPGKEELLTFCKPEFAYATQVIKRYYPDYTT